MRRKRDSNPRRCYPQRFSRPPHSTALPFLQMNQPIVEFGCKGTTFSIHYKEKSYFLHDFFTILFIKLIFNILQMDRKNILGKCFFIQK